MPHIIITALTAGLGTQFFKFLRGALRDKKFDWRRMNTYGGMPSAHTAFVSSLTTAIGIQDGINSPAFAVAFILSGIIIRDAIGFRRYLGNHGHTLNQLVQNLPDDQRARFPQRLQERIGHTPTEALVGGCIGNIVAVLYYQFVF
jgi:acid phosphatase family membrane protein YuiD